MNIDVFIMAGGDQLQWKEGLIKHLARVDNGRWSVVERSFALAQKYLQIEPVVVTRSIDISLATNCYSNPDLCGATLCESMSLCLEFSEGDGALFLLGDVYYTRKAFETILKANVPFFGSRTEMFACKFNRGVYERATNVLYYIDDLRYVSNVNIPGKMWDMYYLWSGYERGHQPGKDFRLIEDDTCDFDTAMEYRRFKLKGIDDWFEV